jgi:S1-C subfamily serine protease
MIRALALAAAMSLPALAPSQMSAAERAAVRLAQVAPNAQVPPRGWLGVRIEDVTPEMMDGQGIQSLMGAYVVAALPGGPAASALQPGDIVLSVNNHEVSDAKDFVATIQGAAPGTEIKMRIWRDHATNEVKVKLGAVPPTAPPVR